MALNGGKSYLAKKIIELMPPRCKNPNSPAADDPGYLHFVEPYFGGGAVLLANDPEGISEVANDVNSKLTVFWRVLKYKPFFDEFLRIMEATPFSEMEWGDQDGEPIFGQTPAVRQAANFFIRCRQSLAGRMDTFAPLSRNRTRRGMNEQVSAWLNAVDGLSAVHERLKRVVILNGSALDVIRQQDGPRSLFYLDPPYMHETRATTGEYEHEMNETDHENLLTTLQIIKGRFLLSGYRSDLYDSYSERLGWRRVDWEIDNKAAGGKSKRKMIESVWMNYWEIKQ